ncbi:MAG TPA: flagellin [Lachnoclostridium sp.]|jgi:flagellin|uniref:flagellin N-terminal helical domain-containing protein n=1 Tax=Lacrimispora sp. TaxID=2719234 RepID=UPI000EEF760D|nr:flagellin [Lacrimispora sp.]HCD42872.1 flagellin [Lachnoclostridium sp.]
MRIQHNIAALNAHRQLGNNNTSVGKSLEKLSSGYRINRAGDDAAGLAISEKMRAQITSLDTAQKNANDGISLIQTAEGALTEVHSMLNRMVELSMQSANGIYDDGVDRKNLNEEFSQLKEEINRIADTTTFNGTKLLNSDSTQITLQIGDTAATTNQLGVKISSIKTDATDMNIDGEKIDSYANAKTAVSNVKNAINYVSSIRGKLGAYQNRLEHTVNNLGATSENMTAAESRIRDVDMAKEMMSYTKNNILVQASQAMLAQANQLPQGVLQLLQ